MVELDCVSTITIFFLTTTNGLFWMSVLFLTENNRQLYIGYLQDISLKYHKYLKIRYKITESSFTWQKIHDLQICWVLIVTVFLNDTDGSIRIS